MKKKPNKIISSARYDIPASYCREAGRILVRWAYLEHAVRRLTWDALGVSVQLGRLAVRDPLIEDQLEMLLDIGHIRGFSIDREPIQKLKGRINEISKLRNLLCHGLWIQSSSKWYLQQIGGSYPNNYEAEHKKRRINPEAIEVDLEGLRTVSDGIVLLIKNVATLREYLLAQLQALPETGR